jgi:hypothetical protein
MRASRLFISLGMSALTGFTVAPASGSPGATRHDARRPPQRATSSVRWAPAPPSLWSPTAARGAAHTRRVSFRMPYLESFQTTEAGEDEVFLVVAGAWSGNRGTFKYRYPNATGHWSLNDREGDPPVVNQTLIDFTMSDGDQVDFVVMVLEEDGGTLGGWADLAGGAISVVEPGLGTIFSAVALLFGGIEDTDDFLGGMVVHIRNIGGNITTTFEPRDRVYGSSDPNQAWVRWNVDFNGDGSNYRSQWEVPQ